MTNEEWIKDREAWQHIYDFLMMEVRPRLGTPYSPPEMVFPAPVFKGILRLMDTYKPTTFGQRMTGQETLPDGTVKDVS